MKDAWTAGRCWLTVQPSSLLRGPLEGREEAFTAFTADLARARQGFEGR